MGEGDIAKDQCVTLEDGRLEALLNAVDNRTVHQQMMHDSIAEGFMALARERYRNPSSLERLGHLVYDNREDMKSNILVKVERRGQDGEVIAMSKYDPADDKQLEVASGSKAESNLRKRNVGNNGDSTVQRLKANPMKDTVHIDVRNRLMAIPSGEVRAAIKNFRLAVDQAVELANATNKVDIIFDKAD